MKSSWLGRLKFKLVVAFRLRARPRVITIDGLKVCADRKILTKTISKSLYREIHEQPERELASRHLRPGDRILEIGAGIGLISLVCARVAGPDNFLSYEANPALEKIIRDNFALNGMTPNLRLAAVAPEAGETTFYFNDDIYSSSLVNKSFGGAERVRCDGFADVLAEFRPNVLVMDVEGAEVDILPAGDLSGLNRIILELHPKIVGQDRIDGLLALLRGQGFHLRETLADSAVLTR